MRILRSKKIQLMITLLLCAMIIAMGSVAWFSATQRALNEFSFIPEGVNLHDDFSDPNKDVYVENTGMNPLLVRIKLREFMDVGNGDIIAPKDAVQDTVGTWHNHNGISAADECEDTIDSHGDPFAFHGYWDWIMGGMGDGINDGQTDGQKWYVPAKDSPLTQGGVESGDTGAAKTGEEAVVRNGVMADGLPESMYDSTGSGGSNADGFQLFETYQDLHDAIVAALASEPHDLDDLEDAKTAMGDAFATSTDAATAIDAARKRLNALQDEINKFTMEQFGVRLTRPAVVLTMDEWLTTGDSTNSIAPMALGDFWVIDEDGWCYWANPLETGEATGLLLDAVNPGQGVDDLRDARTRYYYGIDVSMQAATADDAWQFYNTANPDISEYGVASTEAEALLLKLAQAIDTAATLDEPAGSGTAPGGVTRRAAPETAAPEDKEEEERSESWYLSGDVWMYNDGRWSYDGTTWTLDGGAYPFDEDAWFMIEDEWHYMDDDWMFNGDVWLYHGWLNQGGGNDQIVVEENPGSEIPTAEIPAAEIPGDEIPGTEIPGGESPVIEIPVIEAPVVESPVTELPVTENPVTEIPIPENPVIEFPVTENQIAAFPGSEPLDSGEYSW